MWHPNSLDILALAALAAALSFHSNNKKWSNTLLELHCLGILNSRLGIRLRELERHDTGEDGWKFEWSSSCGSWWYLLLWKLTIFLGDLALSLYENYLTELEKSLEFAQAFCANVGCDIQWLVQQFDGCFQTNELCQNCGYNNWTTLSISALNNIIFWSFENFGWLIWWLANIELLIGFWSWMELFKKLLPVVESWLQHLRCSLHDFNNFTIVERSMMHCHEGAFGGNLKSVIHKKHCL